MCLMCLAPSRPPSPRTVSADPSMHEECFRGAKFLLRLLESIGCEVKLAQVGPQHGAALALLRGA